MRIPIASPALLVLTVQIVLHKYSDALRQTLRDADQPDRCELCCTDNQHAGCVPRAEAVRRTYRDRRTNVGPEFARDDNRKSPARSGRRFSLLGPAGPVARNPPFLRGT